MLRSWGVQVDQRHEAILVPIYGVMVPFHILTLKNATVNQDGSVAFIRLNFNFGEHGSRVSLFSVLLDIFTCAMRSLLLTAAKAGPRRAVTATAAKAALPEAPRQTASNLHTDRSRLRAMCKAAGRHLPEGAQLQVQRCAARPEGGPSHPAAALLVCHGKAC